MGPASLTDSTSVSRTKVSATEAVSCRLNRFIRFLAVPTANMAKQRKGRVGSAGRYGPRYGRVARKRVAEIEGEMRADHECPECGEERVTRTDTGIWTCESCGHTFTGGTFRPETPAGQTVDRSIRAAIGDDE